MFEKFNQWEREDFRKKKERKRFHEVLKLEFVVRPLSPSSDKQTSISPYNITTCSNIETLRIKEMITKNKMSGWLCEFSQVVP